MCQPTRAIMTRLVFLHTLHYPSSSNQSPTFHTTTHILSPSAWDFCPLLPPVSGLMVRLHAQSVLSRLSESCSHRPLRGYQHRNYLPPGLTICSSSVKRNILTGQRYGQHENVDSSKDKFQLIRHVSDVVTFLYSYQSVHCNPFNMEVLCRKSAPKNLCWCRWISWYPRVRLPQPQEDHGLTTKLQWRMMLGIPIWMKVPPETVTSRYLRHTNNSTVLITGF